MDQLTIRGFDKELERRIRELARRERISLNQAVLRLVRKGAGLGGEAAQADVVGAALDAFIGTWSAAQAREIDSASACFEELDPSLWR